jgi:FixJ family two-component response regulator
MIDPVPLVLIVSGNDCIRCLLQQLLAAHGLHAFDFQSGTAYMAQPQPQVPACLILDVELGDMSGFELQRRLSGTSPPAIFVSRHADIAHSVRAFKAGALDFLTPPLEPEILLAAVQAAINLDASTRAQREKMKQLRERYQRLTPRERQVLPMVVSGMLNKQVASVLGISEVTVEIHRGRVMQKLGAGSFAALVRMADWLAECERMGENPPRAESTSILPTVPARNRLRIDPTLVAGAWVGAGVG